MGFFPTKYTAVVMVPVESNDPRENIDPSFHPLIGKVTFYLSHYYETKITNGFWHQHGLWLIIFYFKDSSSLDEIRSECSVTVPPRAQFHVFKGHLDSQEIYEQIGMK